MDQEEREHLEGLRQLHRRRLHDLEGKAAILGMSTPPEMRFEIEDIQASIARIDAALSRPLAAEHLDQIALPKRARHNLPAQMTTLIGREREVARICALLRGPHIRLVTLTGPGGAGKTRLGLQAAAELFEDFPDGVFFVALAPIAEPSLVVPTIAQALGLRPADRQRLAGELQAFLRERTLLLLLDNFEQVVQAAPVIGELLAEAPGLKALVTSRVVLQIYGEREYIVPPLSLPPTTDDRRPTTDDGHATVGGGRSSAVAPAIETITQYEAVRLFIERALAVKPNFAITNDNAPAVAEICARLDGLPLAIELAAARIKFLTPQALLEKLERRLSAVIGGARDLPARQQTLRGAIDWSYNLLDMGERVLFSRFAVFVGGTTVGAAEAVCNADGDLPIDLAGGIESLVNKSLLYQIESPDGEPRFAMRETIREYALEKLEVSGEASGLRDRHLAFFQAFLDTIKRASPDAGNWRDHVDLEHDNLRAALAWSQSAPTTSVTALQLGNALAPFWTARGYYQEGQRWLEQALERDQEAPERLRANVLYQVGDMAYQQGDYKLARSSYEQSLVLFRTAGAKGAIANVLRELAWIDYFMGDQATARAQIEESLVLHRETGNQAGIASGLILVGRLAANSGDHTAAKAYLEESLAIRRQIGAPSGISGALNQLGDWLRQQGDYAAARQLYDESLAIRRRAWDNKHGMAGSLVRLGSVAVWQGEFERATQLFNEGLSLYREIGARRGVAWTLSTMGWAAQARADYVAARQYCEQSRSLFQAIGERGTTANQIRNLGDICMAQGDYAAADHSYQESLALWRALDNPLGIAMTIRCLGRLAYRQQAYEQATALFEESLTMFRTTASRYDVARVLVDLARAVTRRGDDARARLLYAESLAIAREIDRPSAMVAALEGRADLALAQADPIGATRLLGVSERIREEKSVRHWPADRPDYDALIDAARAALEEEAFNEAWEEGRALMIEQAVAASLNP